MTPEQVKKIMAALEAGDSEALAAICKELLAAAAGGAGGEAGGEGAPLAEAGDPPASKPGEKEAEAAAMTQLAKALGVTGAGEIVAALSSKLAQLDGILADTAVLELSSRRELCAELVKLGAETPATVWTGKPEDRNPCKRIMSEPIADLRSRVATLKLAKGGPSAPLTPPEGGGTGEEVKLSKEEKEACKKAGISEADYIERKASAVRRNGKK